MDSTIKYNVACVKYFFLPLKILGLSRTGLLLFILPRLGWKQKEIVRNRRFMSHMLHEVLILSGDLKSSSFFVGHSLLLNLHSYSCHLNRTSKI